MRQRIYLSLPILLLLLPLGACSLFGQKKQDPPPRQEAPKPAYQQTASQPSAWRQGAGGKAKTPDKESMKNSGYSAHADRIAIGQMESQAREGPSAAPQIARFLADASPKVQARALEILSDFGPKAEPALGRIIPMSRDIKPGIRLAAVQCMAKMGSPKAADALEQRLKDPAPAVQVWALAGLNKLDADDCTDRLEDLVSILVKHTGPTAEQAAEASKLFNCCNKDVVDDLRQALAGGDERVRASAARALGYRGAAAKAALPALIKAISDPKAFRVKQAALLALAKFGPSAAPAIDKLIKLLKDPAPRFRELAAHVLGQIGPAASAAVGPLKKASIDEQATVQAAAKRALAAIGEIKP